MLQRSGFQTLLTLIILVGMTTLLFLYTSGYRIQREKDSTTIDLTKTGMIGAKSVPDGANVYLDGKLRTATDDTIAGVEPGIHTLKIAKKGYEVWEKEIEVFEELVSDITAILVSQSPRLEPLTNTGAQNPSISPSLDKLAYFSKDETSPGVWVLSMGQGAIGLFKTNPAVILEDTVINKYSEGESIMWSPDETQLLVQMAPGRHYLVDLQTNTARTVINLDTLLVDWRAIQDKKRVDFISKLDIPDNIKQLAVSEEVSWAPDQKKFLYTEQVGDTLQYRVYNMEKPLPVGEKVETVVFETNANSLQPTVTWYADSFHLLLAEGNIEGEKQGIIYIIRIDGSNKTEVYSNTLHSPHVYSAPGGDKVIVLTSVKSGEQINLYTVGLR
ncbi:PEGA domain-containing protein [Patescibacteria group bacterium]